MIGRGPEFHQYHVRINIFTSTFLPFLCSDADCAYNACMFEQPVETKAKLLPDTVKCSGLNIIVA